MDQDIVLTQDGQQLQKLLNAIQPPFQSVQPASGMLPNIMYVFGTLPGDTVFLFAAPEDSTIVNHYYFTFDTPDAAPTITWPSAITAWNGGSAPTINASKHYEVSVINGVATFMEV